MTHRYFVESPIAGDRATLAGAEAHHLIHVMRCHTGDAVTLFDGSGAEFSAEIVRLGRAEAELAVLSRQVVDRELPFCVTLAVALPKGDRQRWLVEKAVELGASRLVPLETARGVAQPEPQALSRLRRSVIEAAKQCGRNRLMEISEPAAWSEFAAAPFSGGARLLAHFGGTPIGAVVKRQLVQTSVEPVAKFRADTESNAVLDRLENPPHDFAADRQGIPAAGVTLAIGPEGGFTDEEAERAHEHGWEMVDLGPRTLRVETAAAMLLSAVTLSFLPDPP